jgi:hypothetical protein
MATTIFLVNPREGAVTPPGYLLDTYSATAAYSLRQLKTGVTNVVRVRRSSGNKESDFTATEITDGTLASFCGSGDGFVVSWIDQSGSGNTLTQSTASNQPQLVSSGTVLTAANGLPAVQFPTVRHFSLTSSINTTSTMTEVFVFNRSSSGTQSISYGGTGTDGFLTFWFTDNNNYWRPSVAAGAIVDSSNTSTGDFLSFTVQASGTASNWKNGTAKLTPSYSFTSAKALTYLGRRAASYTDGFIQESILFNTDESANRTAIETDINTHYSIY